LKTLGEELAPRARLELATLRLTAVAVKNLSAASVVAYRELGAILASFAAPNPAPKFAQQVLFTYITNYVIITLTRIVKIATNSS
jgi:hypothetical protein